MWHWLVHVGHLYPALVGWVVGFLMASVLGVGLSRPLIVRIRGAFRKHEQTQEKIADHLDTKTPGGLGTVVKRLDEQTMRLEQQTASLDAVKQSLEQPNFERGQE